MVADFDRYSTALTEDADRVALPNPVDIRLVGSRRTRANRIAAGVAAGLCVIAAVGAGVVLTAADGPAPHLPVASAPASTASSTPGITASPSVTAPAAADPTPTAPASKHPVGTTATTCRGGDFGHATLIPDDSAGLLLTELRLTMTGGGSCRLAAKPVIWLVDSSTGRAVRLDLDENAAAHPGSPLTVHRGQTITTRIDESDPFADPTPPAECGASYTAFRFRTIRIEFADGVKTITGLDLDFPCRDPGLQSEWVLNALG